MNDSPSPGKAPVQKSSSSFPAFCSKAAGAVIAISLGALIFDAEPAVKEMAKTALKYALVCWVVFAGIPYLLGAPKEIMRKAGIFMKYAAMTVAFPFAIRMFLKNGAGWKQELLRILQEKFGMKVPAAITPSVDPVVIGSAGGDNARTVDVPRPPDTLPAPFNKLPYNPRTNASSSINEMNAPERLSTAIQMAGLNVDGPIEVISIERGPTLQTIAFRLPPKLQLSVLMRKRDDLGNHFGHQKGFDIISTEHQSSAAFVIPNEQRADVYVRDIALEFLEYSKTAELPMILGKDSRGNPKFADVAKFPHLLSAGSTGSGKSVWLNTGISSLTSVRSPAEVEVLLIDPKMVELTVYRGLPHLIAPPITDARKVMYHLHKSIAVMEQRYSLFSKEGVRNLLQYNKKMAQNGGLKLPYQVIVIDEYGDLTLVLGGDLDDAVQRLGQKARAAGIHMILTTQRPSVDVVTGVIKANLPSRMTFRMASTTDFMTIMDTTGPNLLGRGDGMFSLNGSPQERFQSATIGDEEESVTYVVDLIKHWKSEHNPPTRSVDPERDYEALVENSDSGQLSMDLPGMEEEAPFIDPGHDELLPKAVELAKESDGSFCVSFLQRRLRLGYTRAARLVDYMEQQGWIEEFDSQRPGRAWIGGDVQLESHERSPNDEYEHGEGPSDEDDEYSRFCWVVQQHGGFSMAQISKQMQLDGSTVARYVEQMIKEGLLGDFDNQLKQRPYIGQDVTDKVDNESLPNAELVGKVREYICRMRSAKTSEVRDMFQIRKEDLTPIYKQLVDEGFLNDLKSKKEGYTIAWTDQQIEEYLARQGHS